MTVLCCPVCGRPREPVCNCKNPGLFIDGRRDGCLAWSAVRVGCRLGIPPVKKGESGSSRITPMRMRKVVIASKNSAPEMCLPFRRPLTQHAEAP